MPDQIPEEKKAVRSDILLEMEKRMSSQYRQSFQGKECCILLEEPVTLNGKRYYTGHTPEYVRMAVPARVRRQRQMCIRDRFISGIAGEMLNDEVMLLHEKLRN